MNRLVVTFLLTLSTAGLSSVALADEDNEKQMHKRHHAQGQSRVMKGFEISPVEIERKKMRGLGKAAMIGLGSYIVNAQAICANCHSCTTYVAGENPFEGGSGELNAENYLAGGVQLGSEITPNITPDHESGLPAGLTQKQFMHMMRTGEHHGGHMNGMEGEKEIIEIMPWPFYRHMVDRDLKAIYAYLKAIPHAHTPDEVCAGPGR